MREFYSYGYCHISSPNMQKDPFYELEMPIRCELFTSAVDNLIERVETGGVKAR